MTKQANQRKQKRHFCAVPVDAQENSAFADTLTTDISQGGLGMVSSKKVKPHQKIAVQLELTPEGDPVLAVGRVKWVRVETENGSYRFGLHLEKLINGTKAQLKKYLPK